MEAKIHLLQRGWKEVLPHIKTAGEDKSISSFVLGTDLSFWVELGVFMALTTSTCKLSDAGEEVFKSHFIRCNQKEIEVFKRLLLKFPPTVALLMELADEKSVSVDQALTVLKANNFWSYEDHKSLTHFLDFLNYAKIIVYCRQKRTFKVLMTAVTPQAKKNKFLDSKHLNNIISWGKMALRTSKLFDD